MTGILCGQGCQRAGRRRCVDLSR